MKFLALHHQAPPEESRLPGGDRGTSETLRLMARLSNRALHDGLLVDTAAYIVREAQGSEGRAALIRDWLSRAVRFVPDPLGPELVRSPRRMVEAVRRNGTVQGDCDDVATLAAAMGKAVGIPARFKAIGFSPRGPFAHVYTQLLTPRGWLDMDITRPLQPLPAQRNPPRVMVLDV